jgi:predicted Zn-dependent peptidase
VRLALACCAVAALGCGARLREVVPASDEGVTGEANGVRIVALRRATEGRVWLSLWVDAGARDATPPQVATLAAWAAADAGGEEIVARTLPDATELARPCTRDALASCLESLARATSARHVGELALDRLAAERQRASGDRRLAEALALEALLGAPVDPFGSGTDDERASSEAVQRFLADHFGAGRLLLVAIGDVDFEALEAHVARAFEAVPSADSERGARSSPSSSARAEIGERSVLAVATLRPSLGDAAHIARRLVARVRRDLPDAQPHAEVFPLRGGAAMVVRTDGEPDRARLLVDHLAELASEPAIEAADPLPSEDGAPFLARWVGVRWATAGETRVANAMAVSAVVAGGRGDADDADPDARPRGAAQTTLEAALSGSPAPLEGSVDDAAADVRLAGGAHARLVHLEGASRASALVLFDGGSCEDPSAAHGATALLAAMAKSACEDLAPSELGQSMQALAIEIETILSATAWGLRLEAPPSRWRELAYLAARCPAAIDAARLESARVEVIARAQTEPASARARVAASLAPSAPGCVAPDGTPSGISAISGAALARLTRSRVGARRARLAIAGDVPIAGVVQVLARGIARWPDGTEAAIVPWDAPAQRLVAADHPSGAHDAVIGWLGLGGSERAALAFARAVALALEHEPGLRVRSHHAGAGAGHVWASVALDVTPDALDSLPAHVERALASISWSEVARESDARAREELAWRSATPRSIASSLVSAPEEPAELAPLLGSLASAPPVFVIRRPQPARRR